MHEIFLLAIFNAFLRDFYTSMMADIENFKLDRDASAMSIVKSCFSAALLLEYNLQL